MISAPSVFGRSWSWRWIVALVLLSLYGAFAVAPSAAIAAGPARFSENAADPDFPESLTFSVVIESDAEIAEVELYWRAADSETLSLVLPEFTPGQRVEIEHEIDMAINYLPPGLDLVWFWRIVDADGVVSESEQSTVLYMDPRHDWRTLNDGLVTLYWYEGGDAFAQDLVETANRTIDLLRDRFQVTASEGIRIVIYGSDRDFSQALPPNSAEWIGGQAYSDLKLIIAALDPGLGATAEIRRMVPHEVSHLIVFQATSNPFNTPPNWLDEGLAVYNQETKDSRFEPLLANAVRDGRLIPVRALNSSFPLDPNDALLSYAESESIVTFIIDRWGDEGLGRLFASFRQEMSYDDAVESSLDVTIEQLDAEWKAWLGYDGDAAPGIPSIPGDGDEVDLSSPGVAAAVGGALGLIACLAIGGLVAFVLAYRARRESRSGAEPN